MEYTASGDNDSPILFFVHGWPDDHRIWARFVETLQNSHCCVWVDLPNYGKNRFPSWGFDFPEIVNMLQKVVEKVLEDKKQQRITLVLHDWGCTYGYLLYQQAPHLVKNIVALDVASHIGRLTKKEIAIVIWYQLSLVTFFLLPRFVGDFLTRWMANLVGARNYDEHYRIHAGMNYPYYYWWKRYLTKKTLSTWEGYYAPNCPVLFLWGMKNPIRFYSQRFIDDLNGRTDGSKALGMDCGHWVQCNTEAVKVVRDFLKKMSEK